MSIVRLVSQLKVKLSWRQMKCEAGY